jgi:eukaryotic-like serine/threonine-protein kinase
MSEQERCPQCGTVIAGTGTVEGVCTGCLLVLGLRGAGEEPAVAPPPPRVEGGESQSPRTPRGWWGSRQRTLQPVSSNVAAPAWAMPAELLRQASKRLRLAALVAGLCFVVSIVFNNLVDVLGWHTQPHLALRNVLCAAMVVVSGAVAYLAHTGRLPPRRLMRVSLGYQVAVALAISLGDHLEPLPTGGAPLSLISWLCIWIVMFPLVVPASPRWALLAGMGSATTWPLAYLVGLALGNPAVPARVLVLDVMEAYAAAGLSMLTTHVIRLLQEMGSYALVQKLDHGGMGEIWRARHHLLARPVAVKLIRPELLGLRTPTEAAALVGRFTREAEATAALHSAHTVALHDFGVTPDGVFYYVMDLLDGLDLETLVRRFGPVPPERAIHLLVQACDSLAEAHDTGLIHRDVKPANIVSCHWGLKWDFVKVLDFGLVKSTWAVPVDDRLTSDGMLAGTPSFMAPEVALGGRPLDGRVDLYGLGCVAYWLLTGHRVFEGRTPMEMVLHHVKTQPIPPSQRGGRPIPKDLEDLVLRCLAKEPDDRSPSAEWLAARLAECEMAGAWTSQRAREWWKAHTGGGDGPKAATAPSNASSAATPSRLRL